MVFEEYFQLSYASQRRRVGGGGGGGDGGFVKTIVRVSFMLYRSIVTCDNLRLRWEELHVCSHPCDVDVWRPTEDARKCGIGGCL